jgi:phage terminase large subunit
MMGLDQFFTVQQTSISNYLGSEFIFAGVRNNPTKIKSTEGIDICWVEEAEKVSNDSWDILIPTIRGEQSEIWITFNPHSEDDPTYKRFVKSPPPGAVTVEINWQDNPWFPAVLKREKDYLQMVDPDAYEHIWQGKCRAHSKAQVLSGKWHVEPFESDPRYWNGPYFGADWGFANDPTGLIKCWVYDNKLWVEREVWSLGLDIDKTPAAFDSIEDARKYTIRADSARPETISYMRRHGYDRMVGVDKWKGSVEDGIAYLRAFEKIIIHPRCTHTIDEARLWSYKVDRLSGDVLPDLIEKHDHLICDATRYALATLIRQGFFAGDDLDLS